MGGRSKIITRVIVFLLLGAIVNVAVAWTSRLNGSWGELIAQEDGPFPSEHSGIERYAAGWPAFSLQHDVARGWYDEHRGGFWMSESSIPFVDNPVFLPLRPCWPGFVINTLFYAAILWAMFAAPFALRRRRRTKRGLCPACAYPMGESSVCTECGAPALHLTGAHAKTPAD